MGGYHRSWTTVAFKTSVRDLLGSFYDDIRQVSDIEYTYRVASHFPYVLSRETAGVFLRHSESAGEIPPLNIAQQYDTMLERLLADSSMIDASKDVLQKHLPMHARYRLLQVGIKSLASGDASKASSALHEYRERGGKPAVVSIFAIVIAVVRMFREAQRSYDLSRRATFD